MLSLVPEYVILNRENLRIVLFPHIPEWFLTDDIGLEIFNLYFKCGQKKEEIVSLLMKEKGLSKEASCLVKQFITKMSQLNIRDEIKRNPDYINYSKNPIVEIINLGITEACNLRCKHCYLGAGSAKENELTTEEITLLIDDAKKLGLKRLNITGGEPFLRNDLFEIVKYAIKSKISVCILTNGTLITENIAEELGRQRDVEVQISVDGARENVHDAVRGLGSFRKAISAISLLRQKNVPVILSLTILKHNIEDMEKFVLLASSLGVEWIRIGLPHPTGNLRIYKNFLPSYSEIVNVIKNVERYLRESSVKVKVAEVCSFRGRVGGLAKTTRCYGFGTIYVTSDGNVYPCASLIHPGFFAGNVRQRSLKEILLAPVFVDLKYENLIESSEKCRDCYLKYICRGGCRGNAIAEFGNEYANDPFCPALHELYLYFMGGVADYPNSPRNLLIATSKSSRAGI